MFWTLEKLTKQIDEVGGYRYRQGIDIPAFQSKVDHEGKNGEYPNPEGEWNEFRIGDRWKGRDLYLWLAARLTIPSEWSGKKIVGRFDFGQGGGGNNVGFESLLFIDGQPYQGVDKNHQEVFFPQTFAGKELTLEFRLWTGLNGYAAPQPVEHQLQLAQVAWLDEHTDDFYYTALAVLQTIRVLSEHDPIRVDLTGILSKVFLIVDWSKPGSEDFYISIKKASEQLSSELESRPKHHSVVIRCIGHTHIDVAWLWRLKHTREKTARSFSTVLRLMEMFPEYVFLQTQPQLYEYLKADYPEIYSQIQQRVKEGRWEAGGAMWLEADCNLISGESMVRQILYGKRFFKQEFDAECDYLWLPDVFGYSWALPQILKKSGISVFMTTKISWNQYNRMPHDTFYWKGIDGTSILTHFITTPDPAAAEDSFLYTYNGEVTASSVKGIWDAYRDKPINQELLLAYGYGDGGGGVNRHMLELRRRLADLPGLPNVIPGRADEYFKKLEERIRTVDDYVHIWDGELYLELHRGTYTSQAFIKRMNRKLELLYREAEWLGITGGLLLKDESLYSHEELHEGWKIILRNQFHDIIPGSSITEVYEDCREEYAQANEWGVNQWERGAYAIADPSEHDCIIVYNSAPWERTELVRVANRNGWKSGIWRSANGTELDAQRTDDGWEVMTRNVPSMGYMNLYFSKKEDSFETQPHPIVFEQTSSGIHTPFYEITWNGQGHLTRIYDKQANREVLESGKCGNVLQVFEDKPKSRHEAWDIDIYYQDKMKEITNLQRVFISQMGELCASVCFEWEYMNSSIQQHMIVYKESRRIDFLTDVDWNEQRQLLKVAFPVHIRSAEATYDIQFGNVKRPTHWNTSWDYAKFETVGHRWADLSERNYGVSLLNDCKYGYDIKENVLRLSLIKSAIVPDPQADQGKHEFTYSLFPHIGDWFDGGTVNEAWALNAPMTAVTGKAERDSFSLFSFSTDHIMVDAVKKAEDDPWIVLRMHEYGGIREEVEIETGLPVHWWQECNLMEVPEGERYANLPIRVHFAPYEIKTLLIRFE